MSGRRGPGRAVAAAALCATGALCAVVSWTAARAAEPPRPKAPSPAPSRPAGVQPPGEPATLRFLPKARLLSTYTCDVRFEIATRDVTFEAPEAYMDGFNFWASRMKGQKRSEVFQMLTMTQENAEDGGGVAFRRMIPKFNLEIQKSGQIYAPPPTFERSVATLIWEGTLDPYGNVTDLRKVSGKDDPEIDQLAIEEVFRLFPLVEGPRDLKIGEGFKEDKVVPLPTRLNIAGLEEVTLKATREFILKSVKDGLATFEVKTTYADDPAFKPTTGNTTCRIEGGGSGEAIFDARRGVFLKSRQPSSMRIDIEAPLKPLPDRPETEQPGLGRSHIELDLLLSGQQTVKRVWGEDPD